MRANRTWLRTLPVYLAAAGVGVYLLFAALAYSRYPANFSPINNNWLSDLGNRTLNPDGADFYVWGCTLTGTLLMGFFISLIGWRSTGSNIQNWLLLAVQVSGAIAAVSLVMSAIYTEDQFAAHQFWSRMINCGCALALFIAPFAFHRAGRSSAVLIAVAATGYASIVARLIFDGAHWLEWPSVALVFAFVCWIGWMGVSRSRLHSHESRDPMVGALKPQI